MSQNAPAPFSTAAPNGAKLRRAWFTASVSELDCAEWRRCFANEIEDFDYHRAVEAAGVAGFAFGWFVVEEAGHYLCVAPAFFTKYDLATTAQGAIRRLITSVQPLVPGRLSLALSCLGSPATEHCQIGFSPDLDPSQRAEAFEALLEIWSSTCLAKGIGLRGIKDLIGPQKAEFGALVDRQGFAAISSMPHASVPIDFKTIDDYVARLSPATRKDMRRKLRVRDRVRVEFTGKAGAVIDDVMRMYAETRERSDWAFEQLDAAYFLGVLREKPTTAMMALYWKADQLIGANLLLSGNRTLLDKFFVMDSVEGRAANLYFLSWFTNIEYCLAHGLTRYESGQASYETKMRLGSRIEPAWIYFRHANPALNWFLRRIAPLLAVDQPTVKSAPEMAERP